MKKTNLSSHRFLTASLSLAGLLLLTPAYGQSRKGPGVGGGTNTKNGELVEFQKSYREIAIDPKTHANILTSLDRKLNRVEYFLPGVRETLERAFEKKWVVTEEVFPPRFPGEQMPIFQNENAVKINYEWIKNTSTERLGQAWLHEMVRSYAQKTMSHSELKNSNSHEDLQKREDLITETLTVIIYEERNFEETKKVWTDTVRKALNTDNVFVGGRSLMYRTISNGRLDKRYKELCRPEFLASLSKTERTVKIQLEDIAVKNSFYADHLVKSYWNRAFVDADGYPFRSPLWNAYLTEATRWQARLNDMNFYNAYDSVPMEAVADFAKLSTSVIEGVRVNIDIYTNKFFYTRMSDLERAQTLQQVCTKYADVLPKIFSEFNADKGQVRNILPTASATSQADIDNFFKKKP